MEDRGDVHQDRMLSALLDLQVDSQPICGRLRTTWGADERFVGWLGFVEALRQLCELQAALAGPASDLDMPAEETEEYMQRRKESGL